MKVRIFTSLKNGVYHARIQTEDWSENDRELMKKYGEPEINLGGNFNWDDITNWDEWPNNGTNEKNRKNLLSNTKSEISMTAEGFKLDDNYARIMTESPFTQKFDIRSFADISADYDSDANGLAQESVYMWTRIIRDRIFESVYDLRNNNGLFNRKEEIFDFSSYNGSDNNGGTETLI